MSSSQGQVPVEGQGQGEGQGQSQVEGQGQGQVEGQGQGAVGGVRSRLVDERELELGLDFFLRFRGDYEELAAAHGLEVANCLVLFRALKRVEE